MAGSAVTGQVGEHYFRFDLLENNVRGEGEGGGIGNELERFATVDIAIV